MSLPFGPSPFLGRHFLSLFHPLSHPVWWLVDHGTAISRTSCGSRTGESAVSPSIQARRNARISSFQVTWLFWTTRARSPSFASSPRTKNHSSKLSKWRTRRWSPSELHSWPAVKSIFVNWPVRSAAALAKDSYMNTCVENSRYSWRPQ
jgi:hypothetical protein